MIAYVIIFLPALVCLFWAVMHTVISPRTSTYGIVLALILDAMVFFFLDACYMHPGVSVNTMLFVGLLGSFVTPCMVPLMALYIERLSKGSVYHPLQAIWVVVPAVLFTAAIVIFMVSDPSKIKTLIDGFYSEGWISVRPYRGKPEYIYFFCTELIVRAVLILEVLALIFIVFRILKREKFKLKDITDFWWKGKRIELSKIQIKNIAVLIILMSTKFVVFRGDVRINLWYITVQDILISIYVFKFCYLGLFGTVKTLKLSEIKNSFIYNLNENNRDRVLFESIENLIDNLDEYKLLKIREKIGHSLNIEEEVPENVTKDNAKIAKHLVEVNAENMEEGSLMAKFHHLMIEEQAFLQPRLSLDDVAEQLNSNKTYVSKLVNNSYNLGFPELVNTLRIDYAEQYIVNHREAKQDEIASACGFLSASSFNTIFKKVTGMTPKFWIASIDKKR